MIGNLILTLAAAALFGLLFKKLKLPAGLLVGAILGAGVINIGFEAAYMPSIIKTIAQIVAGGFIGTMVSRSDLVKIKSLYKVAIVILGTYCTMNLVVGILAWKLSDFDLLTMLMCTIPGGLSDVPLIAADMGADLLPVIMVHFVRAVSGVGIFPLIISAICKNDEDEEETHQTEEELQNSTVNQKVDLRTTIITLILAAVFGIVGKKIGIPAGALVGSAVGVSLVKIGANYNAGMPKDIKKAAQVLSGAYIGCAISREALMGIGDVIVPLVFIMVCYIVVMYVMGTLLHKKFHIARKEAMLMMTPAGASDMALIASDLGINSPSLIVIQVVRLFVADAIMPQVCYTVALLMG